MFENIENSEKSYQKIMKQIQDLILKGELKKGEKLPPERQLSEMLGVGRPTLKQALSALESMGIIESRHGGGNYICNNIANIFNPFTLKFYLSEGNHNDILEFRYILEVQFAKLAALKAKEDDTLKLYHIIEQMESVTTTEERLNLNYDFHLEIAKIAGNSLIVSVYESIMDLIIMQTTTTDGYNYHNSHKKIVEAIQSGNPQLAAKIMSDHFSAKFPNYKYYDALNNIK
jgi:GntR family transcriptional regulator, transcriptional repressor for pyruvate dehydrogenase complex